MKPLHLSRLPHPPMPLSRQRTCIRGQRCSKRSRCRSRLRHRRSSRASQSLLPRTRSMLYQSQLPPQRKEQATMLLCIKMQGQVQHQ